MPYQVEVTDTFGGEANYSWVRRYTIEAPTADYGTPAYRRTLVRRAKAAAGWAGLRCTVNDYGDMLDIRPRGACWVAFVNWVDADTTSEAEV